LLHVFISIKPKTNREVATAEEISFIGIVQAVVVRIAVAGIKISRSVI